MSSSIRFVVMNLFIGLLITCSAQSFGQSLNLTGPPMLNGRFSETLEKQGYPLRWEPAFENIGFENKDWVPEVSIGPGYGITAIKFQQLPGTVFKYNFGSFLNRCSLRSFEESSTFKRGISMQLRKGSAKKLPAIHQSELCKK